GPRGDERGGQAGRGRGGLRPGDPGPLGPGEHPGDRGPARRAGLLARGRAAVLSGLVVTGRLRTRRCPVPISAPVSPDGTVGPTCWHGIRLWQHTDVAFRSVIIIGQRVG